jgi:hypothetical protein
MNLTALFERWATDEGKPYKGLLIDWDAYKANPKDVGCMCAQGQILYEAGWTPERLKDLRQAEADLAVAKLLNISRTHAVLLRIVNDGTDGAPTVVLTDPSKVLGDQWSKILDFWWHLDSMTARQWDVAEAAAEAAALDTTWDSVRNTAQDAVGTAARDAAWDAAEDAARVVARNAPWATAGASNEVQGADILRRDGKPFFFLPAFGFATPDNIPARSDNYGVGG